MFRGVRGATTVTENTREAIVTGAEELLRAVIEANEIEEEDVASVIFSTTPDLNATFPAQVARVIGWQYTPVMGCVEADVPGGLAMCIRILLHWNTDKGLKDIQHIYLHDAVKLRPDLTKKTV